MIGLPLAYHFAINCDYGIDGLIYGQAIGWSINFVGYTYLVFSSDWQEISAKCQEDMERE